MVALEARENLNREAFEVFGFGEVGQDGMIKSLGVAFYDADRFLSVVSSLL